MYLSALVPLLLLLAGAGRCLGGDLAVPFRPSGSYCETVTFGNPSLVTVNSIGNHRVRLTMCDCRMTNTSGSFAHMQDYAPAKLPRAVLKQNTYMLDVLKDVTGLVPTVGGFALAGLDIIEKTIRNFDPDKPRTVEETANALAEQVERELRDLKRYVDDKIVLTHLDTLRHRLSGYVRVSSDCHRLQSHLAEFAQCVHGLHEQMRAAIDDFLPAADPIASYLEYLPVFEGFAFWYMAIAMDARDVQLRIQQDTCRDLSPENSACKNAVGVVSAVEQTVADSLQTFNTRLNDILLPDIKKSWVPKWISFRSPVPTLKGPTNLNPPVGGAYKEWTASYDQGAARVHDHWDSNGVREFLTAGYATCVRQLTPRQQCQIGATYKLDSGEEFQEWKAWSSCYWNMVIHTRTFARDMKAALEKTVGATVRNMTQQWSAIGAKLQQTRATRLSATDQAK